jgi:hypothetical protein
MPILFSIIIPFWAFFLPFLVLDLSDFPLARKYIVFEKPSRIIIFYI